jgi:hypothetical protein
VIAKNQSIEGLWQQNDKAADDQTTKLLDRPAYRELDQCGAVSFAEASVAVPFVGAAAGAFTIAQAMRLASLETAPLFLQVEMGSVEMATLGGLTAPPELNLGSVSIRL